MDVINRSIGYQYEYYRIISLIHEYGKGSNFSNFYISLTQAQVHTHGHRHTDTNTQTHRHMHTHTQTVKTCL